MEEQELITLKARVYDLAFQKQNIEKEVISLNKRIEEIEKNKKQ